MSFFYTVLEQNIEAIINELRTIAKDAANAYDLLDRMVVRKNAMVTYAIPGTEKKRKSM